MAMIVKNNIDATRTLNTLNVNSKALQSSLEKVASGQKINSAKDDSANFAISEKMREQIRSLEQDSQNIQNASSLIKVAEGAVSSTVEILRSIKEKAINAANDTNTDIDRVTIQKEINQFMDQVNDNALVTFNGKYLLDGSTSTVMVGDKVVSGGNSAVSLDAKSFIIEGLNSEWVQASLDLIQDTFGIGFYNGASVNEITVNFTEEASNTLAYVTNWYSAGQKASKLELYINMSYYNSVDTTNENGVAQSTSMYLDRTLAHEFVHAAMAANITDFNTLPKWYKEGGSAEIVHGADIRSYTMLNLLQNPSTLSATLNGSSDAGDDVYAAGFMLMRYMAKASVDSGNAFSPTSVAKKLMQELVANGASGFDAAISTASGGTFSGEADLISQFMAVVNAGNISSYADAKTLLENSFSIIIDNDDTGAITGSDAGGGSSKNAEDIVPEKTKPNSWAMPTSSSSTFSGLRVIWPDGYITDISSVDGSTYTYGEARMTEKKLKMQVGTKANQATNVGFYDMRTKSLGTHNLINATKSITDDGYFVNKSDGDRYRALSYDTTKQAEWLSTLQEAQNLTLDDISVVTKADANIAVRVIDGAIDYALNQQTDIGSFLQRFAYTGTNVTTMIENVMSSESTIRDADMAKEMTSYTKNNVLLQASQSMLAQANQSSSAVLSLLQ